MRVWCKCTKCNKTSLVKITEVLNGFGCNQFVSLDKPRCAGELNYYTESFEQVVHNALTVLNYLNTVTFADDKSKLAELVDTVTDDFGNWTEKEQSPAQMGWVGQNGLP